MYERERPLQDELYRLIANIVRGKRFAGLTLSVQTEFPIDNRRAGISVLKDPEGVPILIIETKHKVERALPLLGFVEELKKGEKSG
jgi:hypothetical protein